MLKMETNTTINPNDIKIVGRLNFWDVMYQGKSIKNASTFSLAKLFVSNLITHYKK